MATDMIRRVIAVTSVTKAAEIEAEIEGMIRLGIGASFAAGAITPVSWLAKDLEAANH